MKKMKKLFAILMTMAMVMGLGITGFAADTNVVVTVQKEYDSFYYLQIVEADTTSTIGWKYVVKADGTDYANSFTGITAENLTEIAEGENANEHAMAGQINDSNAYVNSQLAEKLEAFRNTIKTDGTQVRMSDNEEYGSFTAEKGGLYVILPEKENYTYSPTLVYVPVGSTTPIIVKAKGASDQVKKELVNVTGGQISGSESVIVDGDDSVTANDTVEYRVTMKYPYFSDAADDTTFEIKDTLTNGTFLDSPNLTVTVNDQPFANYSIKELSDGTESIEGLTEITLQFNNYNPALAGKDVVITYSVKVDNDVDSTNEFKNTVESTIGTNKTQHIVISDTVKVTFDKVKEGTTDKLTGAVFALYEGTIDDSENATLVSIVADVEETANVVLPEGYSTELLEKDKLADGSITFDGLDANKQYFIKELVAPVGYSVSSTLYQLTAGGLKNTSTSQPTDIKGVSTITTTYEYNDFTVNTNNTIPNTTLTELPSTGGMGTTLFTIAGCVIMISAAGLFFATRKKAN